MTGNNDSHANQEPRQTEWRREQTNLDQVRYGKIGILAVAAAVRYAGGRQEPGLCAGGAPDRRRGSPSSRCRVSRGQRPRFAFRIE